ncbi:MAG: hypothetical protein HY534_06695 [Chloroflexi bacterium]|nr:hypothetical protein [Chloroflexota bacterium]
MPPFLTRRTLAASGAALVLAAASLGVVFAQQAPTPTPATGQSRMQAYLEALAKRLGITTERLQQAMTDTRAELGVPARGAGHGVRPGIPGRGPGAHRSGVPSHGLGSIPGLSAAANAIGITVEQLRQELPGKSLADVAQAHGKNPADVANALKAEANQRLDARVAQGRFDPNQVKRRISEAIDSMLNRVMPAAPGARGHWAPGSRSRTRQS